MNNEVKKKLIKYNLWVWILSIAIPVVVGILFLVKIPNVAPLDFLPPIYAAINATTAIILACAYIAIRRKNIFLHKNLMKTSIGLSVIFLVMYVAYHMTSEPTLYGGSGTMKAIYYFILITHIFLSIGIIPLVLITYVRAISNYFAEHRKIARYTFPIWMYIAVTGVIIYLMISPYYGK
jgi:putative membrane protein